jgi:hypothetical protein
MLTRTTFSEAIGTCSMLKSLQAEYWRGTTGNINDELGNVTHPGYLESWYRKVVKETGGHFQYRSFEGEE